LFRVLSLDLANLPRNPEGKVDFAQNFFGREAFLTVSGQLNVEAYCLALTKVLHLRADLPRRELEHQPPPRRVLDDRAGNCVRRLFGQCGAGGIAAEARLIIGFGSGETRCFVS
jgi:hypothetical protein